MRIRVGAAWLPWLDLSNHVRTSVRTLKYGTNWRRWPELCRPATSALVPVMMEIRRAGVGRSRQTGDMKNTRRVTALAACLTLGLSLAACSSDTPAESPSSPASSPAATETTDSSPEETEDATQSASPEETTEAPAPATESKVSIDLGGNVTDFAPAHVYCKGKPDAIHHVAAKAERGLPIVEFTPGEFAMVKIQQQGAPEKTNSPDGITVSGESITFDHAKIGNATVTGTLTCTTFED